MSDGLIMRQRPLPETRTSENSCEWAASAEVGGVVYLARSRRGAPFELARALVSAAIPDQAVSVEAAGVRGAMTYPSLHRMATRTLTDGVSTLLQLTRHREFPSAVPPNCPALRMQEGHNAATPNAVVSLPVPEPEPKLCGGCGQAFHPSKPWSEFCSPACRQKAYRQRRAVGAG
jgi:hypothetical protein